MLLTTFDLVSARDIVDKILEASKKQGKFEFDQDFRITLFEKFILDDNDADGEGFEEELLKYIRSESKRLKDRCEFLSEKANQKKGFLSADEIREMRAMWGADWREVASYKASNRKPDLDALWNALKKDQPLPQTKLERLEIEVDRFQTQANLWTERRKGLFALATMILIPVSYLLYTGIRATGDGYCSLRQTIQERFDCPPMTYGKDQ